MVEVAKVSKVTAFDKYSYVGLFNSEPIVISYYKKYREINQDVLKKPFLQLRLSILALCLSVKDSQTWSILSNKHKHI